MIGIGSAQNHRFAKTLAKMLSQAFGEAKLRLVLRNGIAVWVELQPLFADIGVFKSLPGFVVQPWQNGLQQPDLPGDKVRGLPYVGDPSVVQNDREGGVFGDGDDGDDQQHCARGE